MQLVDFRPKLQVELALVVKNCDSIQMADLNIGFLQLHSFSDTYFGFSDDLAYFVDLCLDLVILHRNLEQACMNQF